MITYKIEFEEMPSGAMRVHLESPPVASTTIKEQMIAKAWADYNEKIMQEIAIKSGGRFEIPN